MSLISTTSILSTAFDPTKDPNGVFIDPSAGTNGTGTLASPYNTWSSVTFTAGHDYYQKAGTTFTGIVTVSTMAPSSSPIVISSYSTGANPAVVGSFDLNGCSYVTLSNFTVGSGTYASVIIRNGTTHVTVSGNTLSNSALSGINITSAPGGNNLITNNTISGHAYYGVAVYEADSGLGTETTISNNVVTDNISHGMEIKGNHYIITNNIVTNNGTSSGGSSGIHVYAGGYNGDPFTSYGASNTITYNSVSTTHDSSGSDGNGIELDQETNNNTVKYNYCFNNDGIGINLYDAYSNTVQNNFTYNNSIGTSSGAVVFAELAVTGSSAVNDNHDNTITNNTFIATGASIFGVYVDYYAANQTMVMSGNTFVNAASSNVWSFNSTTGNGSSFNTVKWTGNAVDTIKSGTPGGVGSLSVPSFWYSSAASTLQTAGYSISWY